MITARFILWSLTFLIVLAAVSTFASPVPVGSLQKKDLAAVDANIIAREPETVDSELEILAREPSPICPGRMCP